MKTIVTDPQVIRSDDRGDFIQVTQGEFRQLSIIDLKKGASRGKHYHKKTREAFFLYKGKVKLENFSVDTQEKEALEIQSQQFFIIEPFLYHTLTALEDSLLVVLPDKAFDPKDEDIYYLSQEEKERYGVE